MKEIKDFSKKYGNDIINFQGTGGNISIKEDAYLYIKASGYKIYDIYKDNALSKININGFQDDLSLNDINSEQDFLDMVEKNNETVLKSSIETGFHLILNKYVIHTHNIYINVLLCMEGGDQKLNEIFGDIYTIIDYQSPGFNLFNVIKNTNNIKEVIFLKNHGIILHGNISLVDLYDKLYIIQNKIINYLGLSKYCFKDQGQYIKKHIFPDTIIIRDKDVYSAHYYIKEQIINTGAKIKFLSTKEVNFIKNMKQEKYRKILFNNKYIGL